MAPPELRICPHCHATALIHEHPTNPHWLKCELCGFCEKKPVKKKDHGPKQRKK